MKTKNLLFILLVALTTLFVFSSCTNDTKDESIDEVKTITIGTQTWMAENLNVTKYNDGTDIPNVTDAIAWNSLTTGGYCEYNNDPAMGVKYGKLYNWQAVNTGKLAPKGWHIPSKTEWETLTTYLVNNGYDVSPSSHLLLIGKSLASATGWMSAPNTWDIGSSGAPTFINKSGFTALPGGIRNTMAYNNTAPFTLVDMGGSWWSATTFNADGAYSLSLLYNQGTANIYWTYKGQGLSVRCIKD